MSRDLTACVRLQSEVEARLVMELLRSESIPFREQSYRDTAFDGLGPMLHGKVGWGELWIATADKERVESMLRELRASGEPAAPAEENAGVEAHGTSPESPAGLDGEAGALAEEAEAGRKRMLRLLLIVAVAFVLAALAMALVGDRDPCEGIEDPELAAACKREQKQKREQEALRVPRDWP